MMASSSEDMTSHDVMSTRHDMSSHDDMSSCDGMPLHDDMSSSDDMSSHDDMSSCDDISLNDDMSSCEDMSSHGIEKGFPRSKKYEILVSVPTRNKSNFKRENLAVKICPGNFYQGKIKIKS